MTGIITLLRGNGFGIKFKRPNYVSRMALLFSARKYNLHFFYVILRKQKPFSVPLFKSTEMTQRKGKSRYTMTS